MRIIENIYKKGRGENQNDAIIRYFLPKAQQLAQFN